MYKKILVRMLKGNIRIDHPIHNPSFPPLLSINSNATYMRRMIAGSLLTGKIMEAVHQGYAVAHNMF
jgi:hypothetical protein